MCAFRHARRIPQFFGLRHRISGCRTAKACHEAHSQWFFTCNFNFRKDTYMTNSHPITRLQKFRLLSLIPLYFMIVGLFLQPITEILPGLWTLIGLPDHGLLPGRRHRNFLYQRRTADAFMYLDHLFPWYGDGRTYDHIQLPDVRLLPVRKEPLKYLGDPVWCVPLLPLP